MDDTATYRPAHQAPARVSVAEGGPARNRRRGRPQARVPVTTAMKRVVNLTLRPFPASRLPVHSLETEILKEGAQNDLCVAIVRDHFTLRS